MRHLVFLISSDREVDLNCFLSPLRGWRFWPAHARLTPWAVFFRRYAAGWNCRFLARARGASAVPHGSE